MITYKENIQINTTMLERLYSSVGWCSYTNNLDVLNKAIDNSSTVITAWNDNELVGLIRVISDLYTIVYIQDILVRPDFQNKKIGSQLMSIILVKYRNIRQKILLTIEAPDIRHFYEKFGFISCDRGNLVAFYKEY